MKLFLKEITSYVEVLLFPKKYPYFSEHMNYCLGEEGEIILF